MAACTESEIEEKSSEDTSSNAVRANDVAFQGVNSKSRSIAACNAKPQKELDTQLKAESETGDLKELSDDEFLHLLKEASTFNKPNNQESILLKLLRKEVADTDSCEQVRCGESSCVSKRTDRKCSKVSCGSVQNSIEPTLDNLSESDHNFNNTASLSSRTLKSSAHKQDKESAAPASLTQRERVAFIEVDPSIQWPTKARKTSLENQSVIEPDKIVCNNLTIGEQGMTPTLTVGQDAKNSASNANSDGLSFNNNSGTKSQLGTLPVEFKLEVDPLPTLLIGNYQNFAREIRVPTSNSSVSLQNSSEGIELTEFKRTKDSEQKTSDASTSKLQPNNQLSNSKFYVNCNEVDNTVTFPLKLVPSNTEEKNGSGILCDAVNEQLKHRMGFPCFTWPRPQQVHSFVSATDGDTQSQNDGENTSNPFSRAARAANLTSFVSATLLDYPNTALIPDNQTSKLDWPHRKHKRTRNSTENSQFILSQNIEGHRGNEDIDSLLKFIEAPDKNEKTFARGSNVNHHLITSKTSSQETFKRRMNGKEMRNQNKNCCLSRKKLSQSNSDDSCGQLSDGKQDSTSLDSKMANSESECSDDSGCNKVKTISMPGAEIAPLLDINSNIMEVEPTFPVIAEIPLALPSDNKLDSASAPSMPTDDSSFAADFYSVTEPVTPSTEESGFSVVKKKQRKKHQGKRSENYRWHSAAARVRPPGDHVYYPNEQSEHENSMMLLPSSLVQRNQCGKQDSRRKSTSSVPQSEQSSADNSDLDSVHSLPVRGSAPHPTKPHPHTTPSSSSSTPQASYADIARMPVSSVSKLNSSPAINEGSITSGKSSNSSDKSCSVSEILNDDDKDIELPSLASLKLNATNAEYCTPINSNRSTREINTQTEPLAEDDSPLKSDTELDKSFSSVGSDESKTIHSCPLCAKGKVCTCSKSQKNAIKRDVKDSNNRPAVVMMCNVPTTEASDISFGVDFTEILQMSAEESDCVKNITAKSSANFSESPYPESEQPCSEHSSACDCNKLRVSSAAHSSSDNSNLCKKDNNRHNCALPKMSSPSREIHLPCGRNLQYVEDEVSVRGFNHSQVVNHLSREWKTTESEYSSDISETENRVKYYNSERTPRRHSD